MIYDYDLLIKSYLLPKVSLISSVRKMLQNFWKKKLVLINQVLTWANCCQINLTQTWSLNLVHNDPMLGIQHNLFLWSVYADLYIWNFTNE